MCAWGLWAAGLPETLLCLSVCSGPVCPALSLHSSAPVCSVFLGKFWTVSVVLRTLPLTLLILSVPVLEGPSAPPENRLPCGVHEHENRKVGLGRGGSCIHPFLPSWRRKQ